MDPTMISVFAVGAALLAVGAGLAGIILAGQRAMRTEIGAVETRLGKRIDAVPGEVKEVETRLRGEMKDVETRLRGEINAVENRLGKRIDGLDSRVGGMDQRLTLLEGALSGLFGARGRPSLSEPAPDESSA